MAEILVTQEGYDALTKKLKYLKEVKRLEVAERIAHAKSYGDLSENSEYSSAKDEQSMLEIEIEEIENQIGNAVIVKKVEKTDSISIGSIVKVFDEDYKEEVTYIITGATEADPVKSKISIESPIGKALAGKKKGDKVEVTTPRGINKLKVLSVKN